MLDLNKSIQEKKMMDAKQIIADIYNSVPVLPEDYPIVEEDFKKWLVDDSYLKDYDNFKLTTPGKVIIRVYCFEKVINKANVGKIFTDLTGEAGVPRTKILPYAKVIKVTERYNNLPAKFNVGDVLLCPDSISKVDVTNDWLAWRARMDKERPPLNLPEPEKFDGILLAWASSRLCLDKFNPQLVDKWTFIRDQSEFDVVYENK